ncbi:MAG TPA: carboxypeptidase regulatory-like domain-containing protein [Kofleriaceae bacterium]|jgi:protocatechuate 3,4-dioxygenase beta subunit
MRRRIGLGIALAVAALAVWLWRSHARTTTPASASEAPRAAAVTSANIGVIPRAKLDPRTQPRASFAGTVRDEKGAPIANASVCAQLSSDELPPELAWEPVCKPTDAAGAYAFTDMFAADYSIVAGAPHYRGEHYRAPNNRHDSQLKLHAGEAKTGIDFVLRSGGVEVHGTVTDIGGGPIAKARVSAYVGQWQVEPISPVVETDANGMYSLWVPAGTIKIIAHAEGYAAGEGEGRAPAKIDVLLTPESSLSGTIVDARTNAPIAGARVLVMRDEQAESPGAARYAQSDEKGAFRAPRLLPGRYTARVQDKHGYGISDGSTLIGLGQSVDGVVVKVWPALRVIGKVVRADTHEVCKEGTFNIYSSSTGEYRAAAADDDGTITIEGVLPSTYRIDGGCPGYVDASPRREIVVKDKDVTGVTIEVTAAARIVGTVKRKDGSVVDGAQIQGRSVALAAGQKDAWVSDRALPDGSYELADLQPYTYSLEVSTLNDMPAHDAEKVTAKAAETVTHDFVLDDTAKITGMLVDQTGVALADTEVRAFPEEERRGMWWSGAPTRTDATGAFTIDSLRPGTYRVQALRDDFTALKKPGTTDDDKQGEVVVVTADKPTVVKLVVESPNGTISGTVVDASGSPVGDAFLASAKESDAAGASSSVEGTREEQWWGVEKPTLAAPDGTFTLKKLAPGTYTVRAYRRGGGEAVVEHIAVNTKGARLQIRATGSIAGTAQGQPSERLSIKVSELSTGFEREEQFFHSDGAFTIHDLPPGAYRVVANGDSSTGQTDVALASGEAKTGVTIIMQALVTLTGRMVDLRTKQPIAGMYVYARLAQGAGTMQWDDDPTHLSDATGAFTVVRVPQNKVQINAIARDWQDSKYGFMRVFRDLTTATTSTIDIGEIRMLEKRVKEGETTGELGINFKDPPPGADYATYRWEVSFVDPTGPAATSGIKVGDVITTVDGIDMYDAGAGNAWTLFQAPPGAQLALGLARGATVTVTLGPPK